MGIKKQSLGKTSASDRIEFTWTNTISRQVKQLGLPGFAPKPDLAKMKATMDKGKPPLEWFFAYDNAKYVFTVEAVVSGTTFTIGTFEVLKEAGQKRHDAVQAMRDHSDAVTTKDVTDFDAKYPPPPDPAKLAALKAEVERLKFEINRDEGWLKTRPGTFAKMDGGEQEVGFTNWAKTKRYDRYITFLLWVECGRDAKSIVDTFVKDKAESPVKLTDAARGAIQGPMSNGRPPNYALAVKETTKVVDTILLPIYNKELKAGISKRIVDNKKLLVTAATDLKKMMGK